MATDYAKMERAFVAQLKEDTGLDLEGWMQAIDSTTLHERNAIIDWLRMKGFTFSRASWLERIHHNGGQLIYAEEMKQSDKELSAPEPFAFGNEIRSRPFERKLRLVHSADVPPAQMQSNMNAPQAKKLTEPESDAAIKQLSESAKGLRPLCDRVLEEIRQISPNADLISAPPFINVAIEGFPLLAILPHPKKIKLYGEFSILDSERVQPIDGAGRQTAPFPYVVEIDDVREIDSEFKAMLTKMLVH